MRFGLLGPVVAWADDGATVTIPAPKRRALLAVLLLNANRAISTEQLIDALWGDDPPPAAVASLQAHVSRLRGELGPGIVETAPHGYVARVAADDLDLARFEDLTRQGSNALRARRYAEASRLLGGALDLWRGDPLADVADHPFAAGRTAALTEQRLDAVEGRIEADLNLGRHAALVSELRRLTADHPLREKLWAQLMLALYRCGRQADALVSYRDGRRVLVDELGIEPSPELQALEAGILRQEADLAGPRDAVGDGVVRLPASVSRLVGREQEVEELCDVVAERRVVTITGPGGVGKTRLATEMAHRLISQFEDGVLFIDLSAVRDPMLVPSSIGLEVGGGEQPWEAIHDRHLLLVLDNFEQVLDAAPVVAELLARCERLHLIVTSRAPLRVAGEVAFDLSPLDSRDAAELFEVRAHEAMLRWQAEPGMLEEIVVRLDGLPLAIELAAARVAALAPSALREALDRPLEVMSRGRRDAPMRHRGLRATIAWSYELLAEPARATLRGLSAFAGGFDLGAARAVAEADVDRMGDLIEHSLVRREGDRYRLLETIRQFAWEEVEAAGELARTRQRHMTWYVRLMEGLGRDADVADKAQGWMATCARERDNLRIAFDEAVRSGDDASVCSLVNAVSTNWLIVGAFEEGERWARAAVERTPASKVLERAQALALLAEYPRWAGRHEEALRVRAEGIALARLAADPDWTATLLDDSSVSLAALGRLSDAEESLDEARQLRETMPEDLVGRSHTLSALAELRLQQGRSGEAVELARAVREADALVSVPAAWMIESLDLEARCLLADGRGEEAAPRFLEVLAQADRFEFRITILNALLGLAALVAEADAERGAALLGMADRVRGESGIGLLDGAAHATLTGRLRRELGDGFEAAYGAGRSVAASRAAASALALVEDP